MTAILELRDVSRTHGTGEAAVHALRGVTVAVRPGELVAVMGPSGSGKSTLLNLAGGLDRPSKGGVFVEGQLLGELSKRRLAAVRRRSVGYVFQDLNLLPSLTAVENVALPLELDGTSVRAARRLALASLEEVGLADLGPRFPDEMSGASSSGWRSPGRWSATAGWCSPTSRPGRWTRRPERPCCACSAPGSTRAPRGCS
ncbi:hypothetical protein Prum_026100 [Phytohabitans rumicis]|uniref:ABC transporter domain-containing protein n=1 Tax=Phytohabitans rumicis TaxID=1076125 RepID=A0A6V8L202_9ACTN|nr:hypothetical protein Prum_026100 [Phytohabitans rumicis]